VLLFTRNIAVFHDEEEPLSEILCTVIVTEKIYSAKQKKYEVWEHNIYVFNVMKKKI